MTSAYIDPRREVALRTCERSGSGIQGFRPHKRHGTLTGHIITVLIAGVVAVAIALVTR